MHILIKVNNMGNLRAKMFNRRAASSKSKPDQVLKVLGLKIGQKIADIGAGGGYFALRFGDKVGKNGLIYAVDINPESLKFIRDESKKNGIDNIETVFGDNVFNLLPKKGLDLVFIRNVYHHIPTRIEYFKKIAEVIKKDGRVAILDYNSNGTFSFHRLFGHYVPKEKIIHDMHQAGFELKKSFDFLPEQSFLIFQLKANGGV